MMDKNIIDTFNNLPKQYKYAGLGIAVGIFIFFISVKTGGSTYLKIMTLKFFT